VVLQRTIDRSRKWAIPNWSLHSIVSGEKLQQGTTARQGAQTVLIYEDEDTRRSLHGGLSLNLFKDGGEGYWYNLLSNDPYLFVICEGEPSAMEVVPLYITANQDEATGHLETDDLVLSIAMPDDLRELLERYVMDHYEPRQKKKRKRRDWLEDSLYVDNKQTDRKQ